jgi:ATP-dependent exoDNAse (exonuclease V) alpha subunit
LQITLSTEQKQALDHIIDWYNSKRSKFLTLGGYAGTGKTTLIVYLTNILHKQKKSKLAFVSYTGKATQVLRTKLTNSKEITTSDYIGTIHSLIYSPIVNDKEEIIGWNKKDKINYDLIIVDESSMIDEKIWSDLLQYNIPILAIGDHGQLPPISGNFNLMQSPNIILGKIHRQAQGSPIIKLASEIRLSGKIPKFDNSSDLRFYMMSQLESDEFDDILLSSLKDGFILCGFNHTRIKLNKYIRQLIGIEDSNPISGDRVICLRNNHIQQIYNGMLGTIKSISITEESTSTANIQVIIDDDNRLYSGNIHIGQFNNPVALNYTTNRKQTINLDLFDYGYAMTVHKSQGSQANRVVLFEERFAKMDDNLWTRWLYTAVTRAQKELIILRQ